ncbi:probable E3 ubiquitin-protein ligase HERC4 [Amblyraja radiata]|uniref:probable E3 ubiquitin-protein ligase HERC4 n=1 Tax=Amblyraja radiata TaxID=386614 RepID=UPI0014037ECB|nr:probable E3 ubiquitin-protein ligase HERC4 [Amblyraja radiata]
MLCWGEGASVREALLGSGDNRDISEPTELECLRDRPVKEVSCGAGHCVLLHTDGTVYTCGENDSRQLGRKADKCALGQVEALNTRTVVQVACGWRHTLALCEDGSVFAWGAGNDGQLGRGECQDFVSQPRKVTQLEGPIVQVRCGHSHSLALSQDCTVYSWGQNIYGQLGIKTSLKKQPSPHSVRCLRGIPVAQITAGESHSFALSLSGAVYAWGRNDRGQLGLKDTAECHDPCLVQQLKKLNVKYISCGNKHTVVVTKDGDVFKCGDGNVTFQKVKQVKGKVSQIACGSFHTLAYIPSSDLVVSFGSANRDKTKKGSSRDQVYQESHNANVYKIFAGANMNFIQTRLDLGCTENTKQILTLDETIVERWINNGHGKNAENEIDLIFSSPSCLVGSFLKPSDGDQCNVDLESAREIFKKLTEKDWVVDEITSSLGSNLIPKLGTSCQDEEALMIYLILPECSIMQSENNINTLVAGFVKALACLDPASKTTLGKYWSTLKSSNLNVLVQMIRTLLINRIKELNLFLRLNEHLQVQQCPIGLKEVLDVMELVYKANSKSEHGIPVSKFYISPEGLFPFEGYPVLFLSYAFIIDLPAKVELLYVDSNMMIQTKVLETLRFTFRNLLAGSPEPPKSLVLELMVDRQNLVADTFEKLSKVAKADLHKELQVTFEGERVLDPRAMRNEFFKFVFHELVQRDSKMFIYFQNFRTIWFPSQVKVPMKNYFLLGILCGLVVYNKCVVHIPFPLALFMKLLMGKPSLKNLSEMDPDSYRYLRGILDYDDVDELGLDCTMPWEEQYVEVIPNCKTQPLTNKNRERFVEACMNYIFKTSIKKPFDEFRKGFFQILDENLIKYFHPQELRDMLIGSNDYDWKMLEQITAYQGYHISHPTIKIFWKVFHEMTLDEKKLFLSFIFGSDQIPVMGMKCLKIIISSCELTEDDYPEAATCFDILLLPEYTSAESLRTKLVTAIKAKKKLNRE